jgi:hypothetical protein
LVSAGRRTVVTANGKLAKPRVPSRRRPVTRATVRAQGQRAIVRFTVRDPAGVAYTRAAVGRRRLQVRHGTVTVARSKLPGLRFYSVDPFGNVERAHGLLGVTYKR